MWMQTEFRHWINFKLIRKFYIEFEESSGFLLYIEFQNGDTAPVHWFRQSFTTERNEEYFYKDEDDENLLEQMLYFILDIFNADENEMIHWRDIEEYAYTNINKNINEKGRKRLESTKKEIK